MDCHALEHPTVISVSPTFPEPQAGKELRDISRQLDERLGK